jgi:hypothetical protein
MQKWLLLAGAAAFSATVGAQAPAPGPAFELASVRVNVSADGTRRSIGMPPGGRRLATNLSAWAERLVVDRTNLHGGYDLNLEWSPDQRPQFDALGGPARRFEIPADRTGPSLFTALEEQLGLKLESTSGPADVLVIDHVEKPSPD